MSSDNYTKYSELTTQQQQQQQQSNLSSEDREQHQQMQPTPNGGGGGVLNSASTRFASSSIRRYWSNIIRVSMDPLDYIVSNILNSVNYNLVKIIFHNPLPRTTAQIINNTQTSQQQQMQQQHHPDTIEPSIIINPFPTTNKKERRQESLNTPLHLYIWSKDKEK